MGNIPPKQEIIFKSEFIQFIESSNLYEFELFRNLSIFIWKDSIFQNSEIKGTIEINTKNRINKIDKKLLYEKINIIEEKYLDENKCQYLIKYEYKNLPTLSFYNSDLYITSNKIFLKLKKMDLFHFIKNLLRKMKLIILFNINLIKKN